MWDDIIYPFLNFNGAAVEIWEWIWVILSYNSLQWQSSERYPHLHGPVQTLDNNLSKHAG